ncbi:hypothetical protein [Chitinophaga deserti]|uniref:hypothetical protein n=1 Tax=Chitinophaga deserti TaxID=2164099 RepID=UPI000D6BAA95|nr:hypothetical protein [Chitinophaga deserti]
MNKFLLALCFTSLSGFAQQPVMEFPQQFYTVMLNHGFYDIYFQKNKTQDRFSLVMRDIRTSGYMQVDNTFKILDTFKTDTDKKFFNGHGDTYVGGTVDGNNYNFIYTNGFKATFNKTRVFKLEIVDFEKKKVTRRTAFEIPNEEEDVCFFSSENRFYAITALNESSELVIRRMNEKGKVTTKRIRVRVPDGQEKKRRKLSGYLKRTTVIHHDDAADFSQASGGSKLFTSPGKIRLIVNGGDLPPHLLTIDTETFNLKEQTFPHEEWIGKETRINSFVANNNVFSVVLGRDDIRIVMFDAESGKLLGNKQINAANYSSLVTEPAVTETRKGKRISEKEVGSFAALMKELHKHDGGLMVTQETKDGLYTLTIGSFEYIPVPSGGGAGSGYSTTPSGFNSTKVGGAPDAPGAVMYYNPGSPAYSSNNAKHYTTTRFRLLVDPANFQFKPGKTTLPISDQIKDFQESLNLKKTHTTIQFNLGSNRYYGYYDGKSEIYRIIRMDKKE